MDSTPTPKRRLVPVVLLCTLINVAILCLVNVHILADRARGYSARAGADHFRQTTMLPMQGVEGQPSPTNPTHSVHDMTYEVQKTYLRGNNADQIEQPEHVSKDVANRSEPHTSTDGSNAHGTETIPISEQARSSLKEKLLKEWRSFLESEDSTQELTFAVRPKESPTVDGDVSLSLQCSVDRLDRLVDEAARWRGPISVAVYAPDATAIERFVDFYQSHMEELVQVSFHLLLEKVETKRQENYPINRLRNLAMENVETDYLIALDADFVTNVNAHVQLVKLLQTDTAVRDALDDKTLLVLPDLGLGLVLSLLLFTVSEVVSRTQKIPRHAG
jgi:hypothetical protein